MFSRFTCICIFRVSVPALSYNCFSFVPSSSTCIIGFCHSDVITLPWTFSFWYNWHSHACFLCPVPIFSFIDLTQTPSSLLSLPWHIISVVKVIFLNWIHLIIFIIIYLILILYHFFFPFQTPYPIMYSPSSLSNSWLPFYQVYQ